MKLFKNQAGYTEVVTVSLILGIIGALFITGVFVWQEVDKANSLNAMYDKLSGLIKIDKAPNSGEVVEEDTSHEVFKNELTPSQSFTEQRNYYDELKISYNMKYATYDGAVLAIQGFTNIKNVIPDRITFYVPGNLPRDNGNPYLIIKGIVNDKENKCLIGELNLVTGEGEVHEDACRIY